MRNPAGQVERRNMKRSEYKVGEFLYGIPSSKECEKYNPEYQRVFIHNGYVSGDGYGILIGWSNGQIVKSNGWKNFCWGGKVRRAKQAERERFMVAVMRQETIENR